MEKKVDGTCKKLISLFLSFFKIGLFTINGGITMIPAIKYTVVDDKKWLNEEEMVDCIALSQAVPGAIAVSCSTYIGRKLYGFKGALTAMIGVVLPSFTIIILMVFILETFQGNVYIEGALTGIKAAVTGSIFVVLWKMEKSIIKDEFGIAVAAAGFLMVEVFKITAIWTIVFGIVTGLIAAFILRSSDCNTKYADTNYNDTGKMKDCDKKGRR